MLKQKDPINAFVIFVAAVAAVGGVLFGFDTGVISGAILFIKTQFQLSPIQNGMVVSIALVGAVLGSGLSGNLSDQLGRKKSLMAAALIFIIGTSGTALSPTIDLLIISRFILGFAIGIASFTAPLYISEIAPSAYRGGLVTLNQLAVTVGIFVSYFVDVFFSSTENWRGMFSVGLIPASLLFIGLLFLPDSPRWLCAKHRFKEAADILKRMRHTSHVESELNEIKQSVMKEGDWHGLFKKWVRPAIGVGIGLGFFQQFTGINTVIYYAPTIFQLSGFTGATAAIVATAGIGAVNILATILAIPLIDRIGRKPLLYIGMTLMAVCLFVIAISFSLGISSELKWISFVSLMFYIVGFAIGLGPVMWLMFTEVFPLKIRGVATSIMVALQWLFNFIVSLTFLPLIKYFHETTTFSLYGILCLLGLVFVYLKIPETKGVSLEEIEENLRDHVPSRDLGK